MDSRKENKPHSAQHEGCVSTSQTAAQTNPGTVGFTLIPYITHIFKPIICQEPSLGETSKQIVTQNIMTQISVELSPGHSTTQGPVYVTAAYGRNGPFNIHASPPGTSTGRAQKAPDARRNAPVDGLYRWTVVCTWACAAASQPGPSGRQASP